MKKIIKTKIYLFAALCLSLGSCKKVLDTTPYDKISDDVVWSNKANAETFIYSTYSIMNSFIGGPATDARTVNILSYGGVYNNNSSIFSERLDRNSDYGFNNWSAVRRCNLIIEKVQASAGISDPDKVQLVAEAKFLRAMSYFNVARSIGRIVWIDKILEPNDNLLLPSTASPSESYAYIIQDLEDAVAGLSDKKVAGRANKFLAAAMLTEVCLQAIAYKNYPNAANVSPDDPLLEKVITNAQLVISGGYSIEADYGGMFNERKPTSPEIIYAIYRKSINTTLQSTVMQEMAPNIGNDQIRQGGGTPLFNSSVRILEGWLSHSPTQNIADDYLVIDEANPNQALPWNETSQYKNSLAEGVNIPASDIPRAVGETIVKTGKILPGVNRNIWDLTNSGRDARWNASILSDSSAVFYGETLTTTIKGNASRWLQINGFTNHMSISNLYWRKGMYNNVVPRLIFDAPTDYHNVITRLGRVYLNLAEAYLLKGDIANAVTSMNHTRTIHGELPPIGSGSSDVVWANYKRERRIDLVMENDYYWSLLRWGRYGGAANHGLASGGTIPELTESPRVMDVSKDRKSFSIVRGPFFSSNDVRDFNPGRRYLMPIAQSYLDQNPNFGPQNSGW